MLTKSQLKKRTQSYKTFNKLNNINSIDGEELSLFSKEPTNFIVLANIGYGGVGGVLPQDFKKILKNLNIEEFELVAKNGRPFSFLIFQNIKNSIQSYKKLNLLELSEYNRIIFCEYLKINPKNLSTMSISNSNIVININGLQLMEGFLSQGEEQSLVDSIENDSNDWSVVQNRFVKHYGYKFDYNTNSFGTPAFEIPQWSIQLLSNLYELVNDKEIINMNQLTVSKYPKGTGIPPHVDSHTPFGPTILSVSLISPTQMEFTNPKNSLKCSINLSPRSVLIMSGESRFGWEHCIKERKFDLNNNGELVDRGERISLTFRRINPNLDCNCEFEYLCNRK